ncbi:MAG: ExeM/NucH family extracellular endonuclease [Candidatus Limnocylindrales bacterium]
MSLTRRALARPLTTALIVALAIAILPASAGRSQAYSPAPTTVWINEIHYDNTGTDAGEAVEVAGPAGTDLTGWTVVLYNGSGGAAYDTDALSGTIVDQQNGFGTVTVTYPSNGLQNGAPDGIALVNGTTVVQFLSYEGSFAATGGPALGLTSTDIGVSQSGSGAVGNSLRLTGTGSTYEDFIWADEAVNTFGAPNAGQTFTGPDSAPTVASSVPANAATGIAVDSNISVTFSEAVNVTDPWFDITCTSSGVHSATVTGGPTTFTLDPTADFANSESCTVTVEADAVADQDANDPPNLMAADGQFTFGTVAADPCAGSYMTIPQIQGAGTSSPLQGTGRTTEGVVTALFPNLRGFTLLDTAGDADATTSDGIFVFRGPAYGTSTPAVGDSLRLTGRVTEFQNQTELDNLVQIISCGTATVPDPTPITLPETVNDDLERYEGMVVSIAQTLTAQQNFFQGRFGQVTLASGGRLDTPTDQFPAASAARVALADENQRRLIVLDDANSNQNPNPIPYIGEDDTLRAGDTTAGITGLLDEGAINSNTAIRDYRIQPTQPVIFTRVNERTAAPEAVGGWLQVASFNVLNYFNGDGLGGGFPTERGADTPLEFQRQRDKIIAAIVALDADVVGLMEIENDGSGPESAIADLVNGLNDATAPGTYALIADPATGVAKPDEPIKTALIYRPAVVTPIGASRSDTDPSFERYPVAQTFRLNANGEVATVLVNHFKSKGCADATGLDLDQGDGQSCYNATRVAEAGALLAFIDTLQTDTADEDVFVIGDLNSYAREDPILVLLDGGLVDLLAIHEDNAYSYVFDGQSGVLDHALATPSLVAEVTGADVWHINADEPSVIDYNTEFKPQDLYQADLYRASDHDPVLIGIDLGACAFQDDGTTRTLLGDCSTDTTVGVPDGWTLDGDGFSISAFDPVGDHFRGAVVANDGDAAHIRDLTVTAYQLADVCDDADDRLRGILLDGAAGSITGSRATDINQGQSGCQEGNGIEVRNAPFTTGGSDVAVSVTGNVVSGYQKTGIIANGSVAVTIRDNVVTGSGPISYIAQNGVQVGFGASGLVRGNTISGNSYSGPDVACGLLFYEADGVKQQANVMFANERDVCNFGRGGGNLKS